MIPSIIYQTHEKNFEELPDFMQKISETWKKLNPNHIHIYMNSEERREKIKEYDIKLIKIYDLLDKPFQADLWRYIVLYENGGFYADMDSICKSSIDHFLKLRYLNQELITLPIDPFAPNGSMAKITNEYVNNCNFASIKNSKILLLVLNKTIDLLTTNGNTSMGPGIFSDIIVQNKHKVLFNIHEISEHSYIYKNGLGILSNPNNFIVNYYGNKISYSELLNV